MCFISKSRHALREKTKGLRKQKHPGGRRKKIDFYYVRIGKITYCKPEVSSFSFALCKVDKG